MPSDRADGKGGDCDEKDMEEEEDLSPDEEDDEEVRDEEEIDVGSELSGK